MDETKRSILCEVSHCSIEKEIHCFWDRIKLRDWLLDVL